MFSFGALLAFLTMAIIVAIISEKTGLNSILGFLIAGVIIGPNWLSLISNVQVSEYFGNIGVIFLLFTVGLHLPIERLKILKKYVFIYGPLQVIITSGLYFLILKYFSAHNTIAAIIISFAISLSSTAIIIQIINNKGELASTYGKITFGMLLFQDFAVVIAFALLPMLFNDDSSCISLALMSLGEAILAVAVLVLLGRYFLKPIFNWAARNGTDIFMSVTFLAVFGTAYITNKVGMSMELGAFLAGILLAGSEYRMQVEADIDPFKGILLGLFFLSVGMSIDLNCLISEFNEICNVLSVILLVKIFSVAFICLIAKNDIISTIKTSLLMSCGGEFAFVLFPPAVANNLLTDNMKNIYFISISLSMALTPILSSMAAFVADQINKKILKKVAPETVIENNKDLKDHVIIAGFGRVGQTIASLLAQHFIPFIAIDSNMNRVMSARKKGLPVFYGDAKRAEIYRILSAGSARLVVVVLGKPDNSIKAASTLLKNFPKLNVWLRLNDSETKDSLEMLGAHIVIPQLLEPSLQLGEEVLKSIGITKEDAKTTVDKFREKNKINF